MSGRPPTTLLLRRQTKSGLGLPSTGPAPKTCQWIGADRDPAEWRREHGSFEGLHCGAPAAEGRPYCAEHAKRAYAGKPVRVARSEH